MLRVNRFHIILIIKIEQNSAHTDIIQTWENRKLL